MFHPLVASNSGPWMCAQSKNECWCINLKAQPQLVGNSLCGIWASVSELHASESNQDFVSLLLFVIYRSVCF